MDGNGSSVQPRRYRAAGSVAAKPVELAKRGTKMRLMARLSIGSTCFLALTAAGPETRYYQSVPHFSADAPSDVKAEARRCKSDALSEILEQAALGNEFIGYSNFSGVERDPRAAWAQGKRVGATLIISCAQYTNTENAGVIGSTTLSPLGALSMFMPMSVRRYEQNTLFFRKAPRQGVGAFMGDLTRDERKALGTNRGIKVIAVIKGSPAFLADVLPGDVIMSIDGTPIYDGASMTAAIDASKGKAADLIINRAGQNVEKLIPINSNGVW